MLYSKYLIDLSWKYLPVKQFATTARKVEQLCLYYLCIPLLRLVCLSFGFGGQRKIRTRIYQRWFWSNFFTFFALSLWIFLVCFDLFSCLFCFKFTLLRVHQLSEQLSLFFSVKPLVSILSARSFQTPRLFLGRRIRSWELSFILLLGTILWRLSKTGQNVKECYQCGGHCLTYERPT